MSEREVRSLLYPRPSLITVAPIDPPNVKRRDADTSGARDKDRTLAQPTG